MASVAGSARNGRQSSIWIPGKFWFVCTVTSVRSIVAVFPRSPARCTRALLVCRFGVPLARGVLEIPWDHRPQSLGSHGRCQVFAADGALIADTIENMGFRTIRGSSTRGGKEALLQMSRTGGNDLAITPDGPKGPRHRVKNGLIYVAAKTG